MGVECPCCGFSAERAKTELAFPDYRGRWAEHIVGRKLTKRRSSRWRPEPGALDLVDEEVG